MRNKTNRENTCQKITIARTRQYLHGSAICLRSQNCRDFTIIRENTIVHTAQEHSKKTQIPIHPNSLSLTRQENTSLSSYAAARLLGIISIINSLLLATYHIAHIYTCYFIKSAPGIPNTTCIKSISMTGLDLVGPYGLVEKIQATLHATLTNLHLGLN